MTKDEALKMAIEQMQHLIKIYIPSPEWIGTAIQEDCYEVIQACKEALEQPAQEPVAWVNRDDLIMIQHKHPPISREQIYESDIPLYTHPAPSWQGLSDDEIGDVKTKAIMGAIGMSVEQLLSLIVSLTEQALKEKNT